MSGAGGRGGPSDAFPDRGAALVACEAWAARLADAPGASAPAIAAAEFYAATLRDLDGEADFLARLSSETNRRLVLGARAGHRSRVRSELRILGALLRPLLALPRASVCGPRAGNRGLACGVIAVQSSPADAAASQEGLLPAFDDIAGRYLAARRRAADALRAAQATAGAAETTAPGPVAASLAAYARVMRRMEAEGPSVVRRRLQELAPAGLPLTPPQLRETGALRVTARLLTRRRTHSMPALPDDLWQRTLAAAAGREEASSSGGDPAPAPDSVSAAGADARAASLPTLLSSQGSGGKEGGSSTARMPSGVAATLATVRGAAAALLSAEGGWKRVVWAGVALLWVAVAAEECVRRVRRRRSPEPPLARLSRQRRRPGARPRRRG